MEPIRGLPLGGSHPMRMRTTNRAVRARIIGARWAINSHQIRALCLQPFLWGLDDAIGFASLLGTTSTTGTGRERRDVPRRAPEPGKIDRQQDLTERLDICSPSLTFMDTLRLVQ